MDEELYRLISTGLLAAIVLLLLIALTQLGRLQRSLRSASSDETSAPAGTETSSGPGEGSATDAVAIDPTASGPTDPTPTEAAATEPAGEATPDEEGPYEADGRWWFRRDGELLVYDEQLEEWVGADAPSAEAAYPPAHPEATTPASIAAAQTAEEPQTHPLDEARGWDAPVATPAGTTTPPDDVTDAAPAPVAETAPGEAPAEGGHWKCPACGVINGATATSCRMCFSARP